LWTAPTSLNEFYKVGTHYCKVSIHCAWFICGDTKEFAVTVINHAPTFDSALSATNFHIMVNTTQYLQLPTYSDLDGHNVMLSYTSIPSYVTYDSTSRKFTFNPKTTADFNFGE
jgi:hypothetical protein